MATNASFNPIEDPCPEEIFTATALVALRDAGQLRINCHYRVQGPVIGTPGNTSPTTIELHAVTASTLSKEAKVFTTFNPEGAFTGLYDPDADTANGGTINSLTDHWNNTVSDEDAGAPTVQNQWPFHLAGPNLRDNTVNDCTLTGWDALTTATVIRDNELQETTVNLTGATGGAFERNQVQGGSIVSLVPVAFIRDNQLESATVSHLGTGAGSFSFQNNVMLSGEFAVDAATTTQVTANNNVVGGTAGAYSVRVTGKTGGAPIVSGNRLFGAGSAAQELLITGTGAVSVTANEIGAGDIRLNGPGNATLTGCGLTGFTLTCGPGDLTATRLRASGATVTHNGSGLLAFTDTALEGATTSIVTDAADTQGASFNTTDVTGGYRFRLARTGGAAAAFTASRFYGASGDPVADFRALGTGGVSVASSDVLARSGGGANSQFLIDGSGVFDLRRCRVVESVATVNPGGIVKDPLSSGDLQLVDTDLINPLIRLNGAGAINTQGGRLDQVFIDQNGSGTLAIRQSSMNTTSVLLATGSTRALTLDSLVATASSITQNGTGSANTDNFLGATGTILHRAAVGLNATSAATPASSYQGLVIDSGGALNVGDHTDQNPVNNSRVETQSVLNLSGAGAVGRCRLAGEAVLNAAVQVTASVIEGRFTKTPAADVDSRLANQGFDNW